MRKRRHHIIRHIVFLLLLVTAGVLAWLMLSHGAAPDEEQMEARPHRLSVLTWNTERMGHYKKPAQNEVLHFLMNQNADIICLQEVDVYKSDEFLTLPEVKQVLSKKYAYSYLDFSVYDHRHQFGTMVWSRYPLINKQSIHYETRSNLSNRCDVVIGTDTLRLINNHLESYYFTPADVADADTMRNYEGIRASAKRLESKWKRALPLRNAQARIIKQEINDSPYPVIVVGDFNAPALSYAYRHISRGMHDAWTETSWGRWGATCEKRGIGMRIDYILCTDPLLPVSCTIPSTSASDHRPVVASLAW